MSKEAMKLALGDLQAGRVGNAMQILREALAEQPAQKEPVAWVCYGAPGKRDIDFEEADINGLPIGTQLYASAPAQRTWVNATTWRGLTDDEVMEIAFNFDVPSLVVRTVEAKLKEKNQ